MKKIVVVEIVVLLFILVGCEETIFVEDISERSMQVLAPVDGSEIEAGTVNFNWELVDGATKYQVQIASPNFSNSVQLIQDTILSATAYFIDLGPDTYQWRVRGLNSAYETAYNTHAFEIISLNIADEIHLIAPINELLSNQKEHTLQWDPVEFAEKYTVQIWHPDTSGSLSQEIEVETTEVDISFDEGAFIWQVNAVNGTKSTEYSSRSILIDATAPNTPILETPENEAQLLDPKVQFLWQRESIMGSAENDSLFVYLDVALSQLATKKKTTTKKVELELVPNEYYWLVKSYDEAGNNSESSPVNTFTVLEPISEEVVELLTPENQLQTNTATQLYSWSAVENASEYTVQVLKNDGTNALVFEFASEETEKELSLQDGDYIWQVKAVNEFGETAYSKRSILIDTEKPNPPSPRSPIDEFTQMQTIIRFEYDRVPLKGSAEIDSLFVFADESLLEKIVQSEVTTNHYEEFEIGTYYWYLRSYDLAGNESAQSDVWSFTIEDDFSNKMVELLSPIDQYITNQSQQTYEWAALEDASNYQIVLHKKEDETTVIEEFTLPITTKTITLEDGEYIWKVRAQNGNQNTNYSQRAIFIDTTAPEKATLEKPADEALTSNTTVEFRWSSPANAGSDEIATIQVYTDIALENNLFSEQINGVSLIKDVVPGTYYWHVSLVDEAGNTGEQSGVFSFTIE